MTYYNILSKIAKLSFIRKILKYYLSGYTSDVILDYTDHYIVVLQDRPGILFFQVEKIKLNPACMEVYLRSQGNITLLGQYMFTHEFPTDEPKLTLVE